MPGGGKTSNLLNSISLKHDAVMSGERPRPLIHLKCVLVTTPLSSRHKTDWIYSNIAVTLIERSPLVSGSLDPYFINNF